MRTTQPTYWPAISKQGLGRGLQMLLMPVGGQLVDLINPHQIWTLNGNVTVAGTHKGLAASSSGGDGDKWTTTGYSHLTGNVGTFFVWMPRVGAGDTFGHLYFGTSGGANYVVFQMGNNNAFVHGVAELTPVATSSFYSTNNRSAVFASDGTAAGKHLYIDGIEDGTADGTTPTSWGAGSKNLAFAADNDGNWWDVDAEIIIAGYANREWSIAEAVSFHQNPFQFFDAPRRVPFFGPAAAAPTITPGLRTLSLTGVGV